jgi:hypothetical protein
MAMKQTIKYSPVRNIVFQSKIEEQKKLEQRLREKYQQLKKKENAKHKI